MMIKAVVAYDGWKYAGWQKQENAVGIQDIIEKALGRIHHKPVSILASGRTDTKVHALGQVFQFEPLENMPPYKYVQALNTLLPEDIRIQNAEYVADTFHARFDAVSKTYMYVCTYDWNNPFTYRYKAKMRTELDLEAMRQGAVHLIGEHDFTSFSSSKIDPRKPRIKIIFRIDIEQEGKDVRFIYEGNGFLRYQVRMMTGALIEVGKHTIEPETIKTMLEKKDKDACRYNAKGHGLYLVSVKYGS